jgi:hypothetical protein
VKASFRVHVILPRSGSIQIPSTIWFNCYEFAECDILIL